MDFKNTLYEKSEGIATVTINRPKALNALNKETLDEISLRIKDANNDENIKPPKESHVEELITRVRAGERKTTEQWAKEFYPGEDNLVAKSRFNAIMVLPVLTFPSPVIKITKSQSLLVFQTIEFNTSCKFSSMYAFKPDFKIKVVLGNWLVTIFWSVILLC